MDGLPAHRSGFRIITHRIIGPRMLFLLRMLILGSMITIGHMNHGAILRSTLGILIMDILLFTIIIHHIIILLTVVPRANPVGGLTALF
jgi:hypothetical protein